MLHSYQTHSYHDSCQNVLSQWVDQSVLWLATSCLNIFTIDELNNVFVDSNMESITGSQNHIDGGHFWHVEAHCNGMAFPPYDNQKELTCVVCSK